MIEIISIIGYAAALLQAIRIIPQVIKGFITKSVDDIALWWLIIGTLGAILWMIYGILLLDYPIMIGNLINIISYALIFYQKIIY